jgi:hypothetical protein
MWRNWVRIVYVTLQRQHHDGDNTIIGVELGEYTGKAR